MRVIDSNLCYLCGLLSADGSIKYYHGKPSTLTIELIDEQIIKDIANLFGLEYFTRSRSRYKVRTKDLYLIRINKSDNLFKLIVDNMYGHKDFELFYYNLTYKNKCEYIRGLFDGDGSIFIQKNGSPQVTFHMNCKEEHIHRIVKNWLNINSVRYKEMNKDNVLSFRITGTYESLVVLSEMYKGSNLKLIRKYNEYIRCLWTYKTSCKTFPVRYTVIYNGKEDVHYTTKTIKEKYNIDSRRISELVHGIRDDYKGVRICKKHLV